MSLKGSIREGTAGLKMIYFTKRRSGRGDMEVALGILRM
jgi:hypothetical protein